MPGPGTWPLLSNAEIDALELRYINDIIACKNEYSAFAAVAFSHYLINTVGLTPDNYSVYFRLIESGNRWVVDALVGKKDPSKFFGNIQPNNYMLGECFRMLTKWKSGEVYPKALVIIYGLLTLCFKDPEEGYRLYPLTVTDVNNLGKHLDKTKDQMEPLNRTVLSVLDEISSLIEPQKPMPSREIQDVALQANNIRGKFLDMTKRLNEAIPDILLERGDYTANEIKPNIPVQET
ncbi:MAG TPA: hypothetical protein DIC34_02235 [Treponema sp.]|nr:MAG: hypothetical protein A2001_09180 [Treponema sp. GWC1_61_84]HCM25362.1 hypothetical protein [Treponema sp.]